MKTGKSFSPCHITGLFQICDESADALHVGSRGAGVSLNQGVQTTVTVKKAVKNSAEIKINGLMQNSAQISNHVINTAISKLQNPDRFNVTVEHHVNIPMGAGFGTSGATALSLALALNEALDLNMTRIEAAQMAHVADVECKTGLGTVIAETFGGLEIRTKPGAPGIGEITQLSIPRNTVVACLSFGPLSTKKSLTNPVIRERVNRFGGSLIDKLIRRPELPDFLRLSREFAEHVGLISERVRRVLEATDRAGFTCSMPMFGDSLFTLVEDNDIEDLEKILPKHGSYATIFTSEIDFSGARVLE
jgi:pantoate kinase